MSSSAPGDGITPGGHPDSTGAWPGSEASARPAPPELPERVAILGLGLMGGSLARALKELDAPPRVVGWSPDAGERESALRSGALDEVLDDPQATVATAGLVVYATPLAAVLDLLERHRHLWPEGALVTELASLKAPVLDAVRSLGIENRYVGSHPMAGGEGSGFEASRADLYHDARVWLVAHDPRHAGGPELEVFWRALGSHPRWIDAQEHDRAMVELSHLPQLLSNALAQGLERSGFTWQELGSGGRDMTRLARSSPAMWMDLLAYSRTRLGGALRELGGVLEELAELLEQGELEAIHRMMDETRAWADPSPDPSPEEIGRAGPRETPA